MREKPFYNYLKPLLDSELRRIEKHPEYLNTKRIKLVASGDMVDGIMKPKVKTIKWYGKGVREEQKKYIKITENYKKYLD